MVYTFLGANLLRWGHVAPYSCFTVAFVLHITAVQSWLAQVALTCYDQSGRVPSGYCSDY